MKLTVKTQNPGDIPTDLLAVPVFSASPPSDAKGGKKTKAANAPSLPRAVAALDKTLGGPAQAALESSDFTGAAGQIGYALAPQVCRGAMFGPDQEIILHLLDIPPAETALGGVAMELIDAAYPLVKGIVATVDVDEACKDVDVAVMVGGFPRGVVRRPVAGARFQDGVVGRSMEQHYRIAWRG